jgi:hypothetical protein
MKKLFLTIAAAVPMLVLAATPNPPAGGPPPPANANARFEQMEKRMRVTRALGLSEALDLDEAQALKMQETLAKFDARRLSLLQTLRDSAQVLQRAASGDQAAQSQVDQNVARFFETRGQLRQLERETFQAVTQGQPPQKRARAAIFLSHFYGQFGMGAHARPMAGRGMMVDRGVGRGRWGGAGPMGRGGAMGPAADCPCWGGRGAPGTPPAVQ